MFWILSLLWAQESTLGLSNGVKQRLEANLSDDFVGVVSVVQGTQTVFQFSKGESVSGSVLGMDSWMPVSSLTNHIVSVAILEELGRQKISVDVPIQQFFSRLSDGAISKNEQYCTVRHLLSHRCGLPSFIPGQQEEDPSTFFSSLNRLKVRDIPGSVHRYSYAGEKLIMMLFSALRKGDVFPYLEDGLLQDCDVRGILPPAKEAKQMRNTFYTLLGTGKTDTWFHVGAKSYQTLPNHSIATPQGLQYWLSKLMRSSSWQKLLPQENEEYGLGIARETKSYGDVLWHSMRVPFQGSGFWAIVPETGVSVVILSPQSNGPYSIPRLGHVILDEIHGKENNQKYVDVSLPGKIQASLPALFPLLASFGPLLIAFILFVRPPIPRVPFAFRTQFCFFAALFVRQSTPFAVIPVYEWGAMIVGLFTLLMVGLSKRRNEPLFYPQRSFGMMAEYVIYGVLMVMWIQRVENSIPLLASFFSMVVAITVFGQSKK